MRLSALASSLHKWLVLIVGVQMLLWVASGLFFAIYPIERVRSEHRISHDSAHAPLAAQVIPPNLAGLLPEAPTRIAYERLANGQNVAAVEFPARGAMLVDLSTARIISPLNAEAAASIASAYVSRAPRVAETRFVTEESPEYRGALPAWRVAFADTEGLAVYVVADTGRVSARRSDLWRVYDALWALHIMDWRDHENFNTGLLIAFSLAALIVSISGLVLLPYSLRQPRRSRS